MSRQRRKDRPISSGPAWEAFWFLQANSELSSPMGRVSTQPWQRLGQIKDPAQDDFLFLWACGPSSFFLPLGYRVAGIPVLTILSQQCLVPLKLSFFPPQTREFIRIWAWIGKCCHLCLLETHPTHWETPSVQERRQSSHYLRQAQRNQINQGDQINPASLWNLNQSL